MNIQEQIELIRDNASQCCCGIELHDVENLLNHYSVLSSYIAHDVSDAERKQFAAWFPRTWNAIQTGDATSFDLPESDE